MGLWIITGLVLLAFVLLGLFARYSTSGAVSGMRAGGAKRESMITYEIKRYIRNRVIAEDIMIPALEEIFTDADAEYMWAKKIAYELVRAGYKIGDFMNVGELDAAPGAVMYVFDKDAARTDRVINSIGCIFLCKDDGDYKKYSRSNAKRFGRVYPGANVISKNTRLSLHSAQKDTPTDWLDVCKDAGI
ncbi:MAG: hypothetical protein FWC71_10840 [Defluviitaleaceae bacterium]|nr:hypothetical protein [Defluviitaleaceae bacterium]